MGDTLIEELQDLQVDPEVEQDTSEELKNETLANKKQDRKLRKIFSYGLFVLVAIYLVIVLTFVYFCGFKLTETSDTVLVTFLGTTTANVIGLFVIVAKYLFHNKD